MIELDQREEIQGCTTLTVFTLQNTPWKGRDIATSRLCPDGFEVRGQSGESLVVTSETAVELAAYAFGFAYLATQLSESEQLECKTDFTRLLAAPFQPIAA